MVTFPNVDSLVYKNTKGEMITRDSFRKINTPIGFDSYVDESNIVREIIVRPSTDADKQLKEKMDKAIQEGTPLKDRIIECATIGVMLDSILVRDQRNRTNSKDIDSNIDHDNLELVVNIIDKCGMPTRKEFSEEQIVAIWLVIQHAPLKYQIKYLPMLKQAAQKGDLEKSHIAMLEDRILTEQGKPQIYGTQVDIDVHTGKYKLLETVQPEYLNRRRKEVGLEPIEFYLEHFGVEFSVPQK